MDILQIHCTYQRPLGVVQLSEVPAKFSCGSAVSPGGHSRVLQELSDWPELLYLVKREALVQTGKLRPGSSEQTDGKLEPELKQAETCKSPEGAWEPTASRNFSSVCQAQGWAVQIQSPGEVTMSQGHQSQDKRNLAVFGTIVYWR